MADNGTSGSSPRSKFGRDSTIPLWLDGEQKTLSNTFNVTSPVTNEVIFKASAAQEDDALAAITSCEKAFKPWAKTRPAFRRAIFLKAADLLLERRDEAWKYMSEETGAVDAFFGFIFNGGIELLRQVGGLIEHGSRGIVPTLADDGKSAMVVKEPYGVCLAIAPWNGPYILGLRAVLFPLAAGNTVILKGSELSPACFWIIVDALHQAGLPAGALNTIYHRPGQEAIQVTNILVTHPAVRKINFTGSTAVGSIISSLAGKHLKPCLMELGGKAPAIVCDDADLEKAALGCALGAFLHSGQVCMSTERIIVHEKVAKDFKNALIEAMDKVFGASTPSPILVAGAGVEKNQKLLDDAVKKGAKALYGDVNARDPSKTRMRPIIIEDIKQEMEIYHTESFGPTVSLYTYKRDEDAITLANDTDYGLTSAVFTEDLRRGLRIAKEIETGAVHINGMSVHDEVALPHGGAKKSGYGRFNGLEGLEEWYRTKNITWQD